MRAGGGAGGGYLVTVLAGGLDDGVEVVHAEALDLAEGAADLVEVGVVHGEEDEPGPVGGEGHCGGQGQGGEGEPEEEVVPGED